MRCSPASLCCWFRWPFPFLFDGGLRKFLRLARRLDLSFSEKKACPSISLHPLKVLLLLTHASCFCALSSFSSFFEGAKAQRSPPSLFGGGIHDVLFLGEEADRVFVLSFFGLVVSPFL